MKLKLDDNGLIPAICQDAESGRVLMLAYTNPGALKRTLEGGQVWFYSRSREEPWHKGEVSGHFMDLRAAWADCDGDTLLFQVQPSGPACHTGNETCFFTPIPGKGDLEYQHPDPGPGILQELFAVIQERQREMPQGSYTARLFKEGTGRIAQKVVEEAGEVAVAAAQKDRERLPPEVADLFYHALVLLADAGLSPGDVWKELRRRRA